MLRTRIFSTLGLVLAWALAACSTSDGQQAGAKATTSGPGPGSGGGTSSGTGTADATGGATADASGSGGSFGGSQGGSNSADASEASEAGTDVAVLPVLIVAPDGQGSDCSDDKPCALTTARDRARTFTRRSGPLLIRLRGGTYALSKTFQLEETAAVHDSGTPGGPTVYEAAPGETPMLSGGVIVTGWSLFDAAKGIYRAKVDPSLRTRQLFVNGVRAIRARGTENPAGFSLTVTGIHAPSTEFASYRAPTQLEAVVDAQWRTMRCGVAKVTGADLTLDQPCWNNANVTKKLFNGGWPPSSVKWLENAYELLDQPGEWYMDETMGDVFYKPKNGENMATASVIAPVLEALVDARGTPDRPIHDITFSGLTFAYSTWLRPSTAEGSATWQACYDVTGMHDVQPGFDAMTRMPSAVTLSSAQSFRVEKSVFALIGSGALSIESASQHNVVTVNRFEDISGCAIQLGELSTWSPMTPASNRTSDNTVEKNVVTRVGIEYHGAVGIFVGFTESSTISHNEISNTSYTGISVGWGGWNPAYGFGGSGSHADATYARNNRIIGNLIHDVVQVEIDGGGIYTQGRAARLGHRGELPLQRRHADLGVRDLSRRGDAELPRRSQCAGARARPHRAVLEHGDTESELEQPHRGKLRRQGFVFPRQQRRPKQHARHRPLARGSAGDHRRGGPRPIGLATKPGPFAVSNESREPERCSHHETR
jgi:hypothetical protein